MQRMLIRIAAILLASMAGVAWGQALIDAENLLFGPPPGFKIGYQSSHDNQSITEWVPSGETVEDWTQMATVLVFRHASVDAATFLQSIGKRWFSDCPGSGAKGIFTDQVNGYVVSMLLLRCPRNPSTGKPETTAFRVIKGNDALYTVQRAFRADLSDKDLEETMHALAKVTVCDTRSPDHPCPSLDSIVPRN
jgi:hypothetical protein